MATWVCQCKDMICDDDGLTREETVQGCKSFIDIIITLGSKFHYSNRHYSHRCHDKSASTMIHGLTCHMSVDVRMTLTDIFKVCWSFAYSKSSFWSMDGNMPLAMKLFTNLCQFTWRKTLSAKILSEHTVDFYRNKLQFYLYLSDRFRRK